MISGLEPVLLFEKQKNICSLSSIGKEKEVESMRNGGNVLINKVYEAKLTESQKAVVKPDKDTELDPRSEFIYDKYQHRKWYDDILAKQKSTFEPPLGNRVSAGAFDDFFASRTKVAASDDWHDSKHTSHENDLDNDEFAQMANNSMNIMSAFQFSKEGSLPTSPAGAKSARGGLSYTRTPKSVIDGRSNLLLQRIDSKREMLDTIRAFGVDDQNHNIHPGDVVRRKTNRLKEKTDRRRGSGDSDTRIRRGNSNGNDENGAPIRRQAPARTASSGSDCVPQKPRSRRFGRTSSESSNDLPPPLIRPRREPARGVSRTKSMDDTIGSPLSASGKQSEGPKNTTRGVRRAMSNDDYIPDAVGTPSRSERKKPPRRNYSNAGEKLSEARQLNESMSSRKTKEDDASSRRGHSPKRSSSVSRSSSPKAGSASTTGASTASSLVSGNRIPRNRARSSSRPRNRPKSQPRKPVSNAIGVRRVPTVRDRSPKIRSNHGAGEQSPETRNRTLQVNSKADVAKLSSNGM